MDSQKQVFDRLNFPRTTLEKLTRVFRIGTARGSATMEKLVTTGHSRSKNGVASARLCPVVHAEWQDAIWTNERSTKLHGSPGQARR